MCFMPEHAPTSLADMSDIELMMEYAQREDWDCNAELFRRYKSRVHGLVFKLLGNHADADDVTQNVFMNLHRSKSSYDPTKGFTGFLFAIARNAARNSYRHSKRKHVLSLCEPLGSYNEEFSTYADELADSNPAPDVIVSKQEQREQVRAKILSLSEARKDVIRCLYFDDMTEPEAALTLGITKGAVENRIFKTLRELAESGVMQRAHEELQRAA